MEEHFPTGRDDPSAGVSSAVSSLKEIVTVIMALTMTNTLVLLLTKGKYAEVRSLGDLPLQESVYSALVILTIFRFYHGNIRHLDSVYGRREVRGHQVKPAPRGGLGIDFFVIFTQSILFAVMSFYSGRPDELLVLFTILLASDVVWVLLVQQPSHDHAGFSHQRNWTLSNVLALLAILAIYAISGGVSLTGSLVYVGAFVILANAVFDFIINWTFYFPPRQKNKKASPGKRTIFVAAPLTQTLEKATGQVAAGYREWLEGLIDALGNEGYQVISAHKREHWGDRLDDPIVALETVPPRPGEVARRGRPRGRPPLAGGSSSSSEWRRRRACRWSSCWTGTARSRT